MPKILIIDDEPDFLEILSVSLSASYEVVTFSSAEEALKLFQEKVPIDLVMVDTFLPGLDGPGFVRRLRSEGVQIPVIGMGGLGVTSFPPEAQCELAQFLEKPFRKREMLEAIDRALGK